MKSPEKYGCCGTLVPFGWICANKTGDNRLVTQPRRALALARDGSQQRLHKSYDNSTNLTIIQVDFEINPNKSNRSEFDQIWPSLTKLNHFVLIF
jgi:hypothetical protein